jgi:hypothetical protein
MSISTKTSEPLSTKEKISLLREKHQPSFDRLGVPNALFFPKMAYRPSGKDELYVSFFESELKRAEDIYTEAVSRDYISESDNRELWLWRYNPHWQSEYETTEANALGHVRYLVPVSELTKIPDTPVVVDKFASLESSLGDLPFSEMTIKDFAAIMSWKPVSEKAWLNELINSIKK